MDFLISIPLLLSGLKSSLPVPMDRVKLAEGDRFAAEHHVICGKRFKD
jgi:hypothetical protein